MINVSRMLKHPKFSQLFSSVYRSSGKFAIGGWQEGVPQLLSISGVTCPASYKDTMHLPEGDRIKEARAFYVTSVNELKVSRNDPSPATSDQIKYQGKKFDIHQVKNYGDYGYFKAIGLRTAGD